MSTQRDDQESPEPDGLGGPGGLGGLDPGADQLSTVDADELSTVNARGRTDESFGPVPRRIARATILEVGSELVGRFRITRVLGAGGMGTVYVARDATLGRDVAIKVHHAGSGAQRLRREAVAMARLAHPNVVTVFEVGDLSGRPFVVMEYIAGTTLRTHLAAAPRSVRDIIALLIAAGEGLAAAHDAGLVHRDIKPENVMVGSDGRARLGDFGLARELDSGDEPVAPPETSLGDLRTPVTQTGAVMGTPAYMSPEHFAGAPVDARADQFAFCVTAWESLWGERPFAGTSYAQLSAAIGLGERRPPPPLPKVPARIRVALERGLSVDPAARFATMHALLDAIRPVRPRRWWWLAGGGALAAAGVAAALVGRVGAAPSCDSAGVLELAGLRRDLPDLLQQHGATQVAVKAEAVLRDYRAAFRGHAEKACRADRAHEWSPAIAARSRQCFAVVARTAALSLAELDPAKPLEVLRRLRRLPPQEQCQNQTHLSSRPELPADPVKLAALTEATAALDVGFDAIDDHDLDELRHTLAALEASPARDDPGIAAGVTALRGWLAFDKGQLAEARKLFIDAYYAGRGIDDEQISSVALGLLIGRGAELGLAPAAIQDWLRTAVSDADRFRARSAWLAGRVYLVAARAADQANDAKSALLYARRAREALDPHDPLQIDVHAIEGAVLMWSGKIDDGIRAYETAVAKRTSYAGDDDPDLAALLGNYASSLLEAEHLNDALSAAERASQIVAKLPDPDDARIDPIRVTLAAVLIGANQDDEAFGLLETARAHSVKQLGETSPIIATIDTDLATIYNGRGEHDRAIAALNSALAIDDKLLGSDSIEVANVQYNLAASYRYKKDYVQQLTAARRAAAILAAKSPGTDRHRIALTMAASAANESHDYAAALELTGESLGFPRPAESPQTSAWAQLERARALIGLHRPAEARPLLQAARASYADLDMAERVRQVDDLLKSAR